MVLPEVQPRPVTGLVTNLGELAPFLISDRFIGDDGNQQDPITVLFHTGPAMVLERFSSDLKVRHVSMTNSAQLFAIDVQFGALYFRAEDDRQRLGPDRYVCKARGFHHGVALGA